MGFRSELRYGVADIYELAAIRRHISVNMEMKSNCQIF